MREFSVVIPSHRRADLLQLCLQSVTRFAPPRTEIIVVDDGSSASLISRMADRFDATVIRYAKARGFCAAVNVGIAAARGDLVELLNDDAEVTEGWADAILPHFDDPDIAAVTPVVRWPDGRIDTAGDDYDVGGFARKLHHKQLRAATVRERGGSAPSRSRLVKSVSACAAFYRRDALLEIGGFPEHFGAYFDDVDVSLRLRKQGYRLIVEPRSTVIHHGGQSHRPSRRLMEQQSRNEEWLYWRNNESLKTLPRHAAVLAGKALRRMEEGTLGPWLAGRLRAITASRSSPPSRSGPSGPSPFTSSMVLIAARPLRRHAQVAHLLPARKANANSHSGTSTRRM